MITPSTLLHLLAVRVSPRSRTSLNSRPAKFSRHTPARDLRPQQLMGVEHGIQSLIGERLVRESAPSAGRQKRWQIRHGLDRTCIGRGPRRLGSFSAAGRRHPIGRDVPALLAPPRKGRRQKERGRSPFLHILSLSCSITTDSTRANDASGASRRNPSRRSNAGASGASRHIPSRRRNTTDANDANRHNNSGGSNRRRSSAGASNGPIRCRRN